MRRPIEESIYDPTLTQDEKLDLLMRHWSREGKRIREPDELLHAVMSEGLADLEAAKYWAGEGGSKKYAFQHADAAIRSDPGSVEALLLWARYLPQHRGSERPAAYLAVLELDPTHPEPLVVLGANALADRTYESIEYSQRLIDLRPDSASGYQNMGWAYERLGDLDSAASYYKTGIRATGDGFLKQALRRLESGNPRFKPDEPAPTSTPADDVVGTPAPLSSSISTSSPGKRAPRVVRQAPPAPPGEPPAAPRDTPEPVAPYQNALNDYRELADVFESITGETYRGIQDFDGYAKESSNWMAWRYMELERQYLDKGHPEEAEKVRESAEERFPDDPLIRHRGQQRGRERGEQGERSR